MLFKTRDRHAQVLREWALARTGFALRRMTWRVSQVSVHLSDIDGPRHGVDKRCQVAIVSNDGPPVIITSVARDWRSALNEALTRAVEAVKRLFRRALEGRRSERRFVRNERHVPSTQLID
jgi:hypothetical protein